MDVRIKRVYEPASSADGVRVLVDRLWPRGVSKAAASLDVWEKDAAPSAMLRAEWHADPDGHDPAHFAAFANSYRIELSEGAGAEALERLAAIARDSDRLTLLYGARDEQVNHAVVLREALLAQLS